MSSSRNESVIIVKKKVDTKQTYVLPRFAYGFIVPTCDYFTVKVRLSSRLPSTVYRTRSPTTTPSRSAPRLESPGPRRARSPRTALRLYPLREPPGRQGTRPSRSGPVCRDGSGQIARYATLRANCPISPPTKGERFYANVHSDSLVYGVESYFTYATALVFRGSRASCPSMPHVNERHIAAHRMHRTNGRSC